MNPTLRNLLAVAAAALLAGIAGCSGRDPAGLEVARARIDPVVFDEDYGDDVYFQAFSGTYYEAAVPDSFYAHDGRRSLKVVVPGQGWALGAYAGGVLTAAEARDFADFNALAFWVRASTDCVLNEVGFGNDNTGTSRFSASRFDIPVTTDWKYVVVPIPAPAKLIAERGLFLFAERWEEANPAGHELWFDDVRFARVPDIRSTRPGMSGSRQAFIGATIRLRNVRTVFNVGGTNFAVGHQQGYFDFVSSNPAVATVSGDRIAIVGEGTATLTATMNDTLRVTGAVGLTGYAPPAVAAPAPAEPAADVIAMFSDAYATVPVDTWNTGWSGSTTEDELYTVAGDVARMYFNLNYVGIQFLTRTIDASAMTHLHLDVYAPAGTDFKVKVVAYSGDNGTYVGEAELTFDADSTPAFRAGEWSSLDIPLASFPLAAPWTHLAQLVLSSSTTQLVLVDNVYWHK